MIRRTCAAALLIVAAPAAASGQVGHPPADSPYRDIDRSQTLSAVIGHLGGSRGRAGVGPASGLTVGARFEMRLSGPTDLVVSIARSGTDRFVMDPFQPAADRRAGPVGQSLMMADVGLVFLITGPKTWHGLAPYVGASFGMAFAGATPQDSSRYEFGSKFTLQPAIGVRYYPTESISLRVEARDVLWRLRYPVSFFAPPPDDPTSPPILPPDSEDTEWTHHPWLTVGIGIAFRL